MHLPQAQHLVYGNAAPQATAVVVQLQHTSQIPQARQRLRQLIEAQFGQDQLEIQDYRTLNPFYGQIVTMFGAMFGFIALLIGAIVLFTVSNTMSMVVVERTMEIGTLRAIGLRRGGIRRLFLCEGLMLGIIGAVLGVLISLLVAALINQSGITWLPPGRVERIPLTVRIWGKDALIAGTALGLIGVAVLSAVWPANRAARMQVVDALRHV
jgi:putative ABC transport system permease protein